MLIPRRKTIVTQNVPMFKRAIRRRHWRNISIADSEFDERVHRPRTVCGLLDPRVFVKDLLEDLERVAVVVVTAVVE